MASFKNKHIKMKILCNRAEQEEIIREQLEEQDVPDNEIEKIIREKRAEGFKTAQVDEPWSENNKVITSLHATNSGLPGTHQVLSSTKDMFAKVQKKYDKYKAAKKAEQEGLGNTGALSLDDEARKTAKSEKKAKTKEAELEHDRFIKTQNFRDHMNEMYRGLEEIAAMPKKSHYGEQYEFTNHMQDECDNTRFDHHLLKNDVNSYCEAYIKHKGTMRK